MTSPMILTIDVPASLWLTSNGRYHWAERARRTRDLRAIARMQARRAHLPKNLARARIEVFVHGRTRRRTDPANAYPTIKAAVDGLIDYEFLPDDDATHLIGPYMRIGAAIPDLPTGAHRLTLHITEETP